MKRTFVSSALLGALSLALMGGAEAATKENKIRICTGSPSGNYQFAGKKIGERLSGLFDEVVLVNSEGSLDNLRKLMKGECDMGFAQADVADLYRIENPASTSVLYPFRKIYSEYVQILCPTKSGWTKLSDLGEARKKGTPVKMIVGPDGSGPAETWRAIRQANPEAYDKIERDPMKPDVEAAFRVKDSADTCMLWVSGLNSPDMQSANATSIKTRDKKPALALISVEDPAILALKDSKGQPLYTLEKVEARKPAKDKAGMYENLIPDRSGMFSWGSDNSISVPAVDAVLMTTSAYRESIKDKTGRIAQQVDDASQTIWNEINPGK